MLTIATAASATAFSATAHATALSTSITSPTPFQVVDIDVGHFALNPEAPPEIPEIPTTRVTGTAT
nr:hypothetical protein [Patulibacter sp.]